jgi:hypothetical protein
VASQTIGVSITVHSQVWIAFVATFVLAVFTMLLLFVWNQKAGKSGDDSEKVRRYSENESHADI